MPLKRIVFTENRFVLSVKRRCALRQLSIIDYCCKITLQRKAVANLYRTDIDIKVVVLRDNNLRADN